MYFLHVFDTSGLYDTENSMYFYEPIKSSQ